MIITVFSGNSRIEKFILAINLAALRVRDHRKVLLIDADTRKHLLLWHARREAGTFHFAPPVLPVVDASLYSELERINPHRQDIVIDAGGINDVDTSTALIAARTVVVPVAGETENRSNGDDMIALLERAMMFNPHLLMVFVVMQDCNVEMPKAKARARELACRIRSARVAHTVFQNSSTLRTAYHHGATIFDTQPTNDMAAKQMETLGREVCGSAVESSTMTEELTAAIAVLKRAYQRAGIRARHI